DDVEAILLGLEALDRRLAHDPDPQPAGLVIEFLYVGARRSRGHVGIAGCRPMNGVEQRSGVADAARDAELDRDARHVVADDRALAGPLAGRLEADETAVRRRDPDRAAAVVGVREGHDSGCHRGCGATARAARRTARVPRVPGRPIGLRLSGGDDAEL